MDQKEAIILLISSTLGASIRILREFQAERPTTFKMFYILLCGFFISYLLHGFLKQRDWMLYFGQACAIAGIISLDLVEMLIKKLPSIIMDKIDKGL